MAYLELKIPPVLTLLISIGLVFLLRFLQLGPALPAWTLMLAPVLLCGGVLVVLAGIWQFRRAQTTVDPTHPDKASHLVCAGIFQYTRNPMYVGMALVLSAGVLKSGLFLSVLLVPFFVWYMTRFQIKPEERVLQGIFTEEYVQYKQKVGRWL